jgi:hypothetical protein
MNNGKTCPQGGFSTISPQFVNRLPAFIRDQFPFLFSKLSGVSEDMLNLLARFAPKGGLGQAMAYLQGYIVLMLFMNVDNSVERIREKRLRLQLQWSSHRLCSRETLDVSPFPDARDIESGAVKNGTTIVNFNTRGWSQFIEHQDRFATVLIVCFQDRVSLKKLSEWRVQILLRVNSGKEL